LTQALGLRSRTTPPGYASRLVFGHFDDLPPFSRVVPGLPEPHDPGEPFPEQWAAVHHLLDLGWMYQLRFDSGRTSAGFLLDPERLEARGFELPSAPERAFALLLSRYPSLERQFSSSRVVSLGATGVLQRRVEPAAGAGWALLPSAYAFHDPLFSTGIAWTLLGVERLAELLSTASGEVSPSGLARYRDLLALEADHLDRLLAGAYRLIDDFPRFAFFALLYFAAASYNELRQRLLDPSATEAWCWGGFLGADDARLAEAVALAPQQAATMAPQAFARWVLAAIAPRDLVGLDDPSGPGLYSARLEPVVARAELLGLTPEAVRLRLPRLRGAAVVTEGRI
jgi:FADH2 O2-dependent halogenase